MVELTSMAWSSVSPAARTCPWMLRGTKRTMSGLSARGHVGHVEVGEAVPPCRQGEEPGVLGIGVHGQHPGAEGRGRKGEQAQMRSEIEHGGPGRDGLEEGPLDRLVDPVVVDQPGSDGVAGRGVDADLHRGGAGHRYRHEGRVLADLRCRRTSAW